MASFLSSLISRDPRASFGYEIPSSSVANMDGVQLGNSAKKGEPEGEAVSVFWAPPDCANLRVQTQKLKTMRHPNILTFVDSLEVENTLYLVTEQCKPLSIYMRDVELTTDQRESVVSWGIYQVMSCLKFLHGANISHENVRKSIYVTQAGDWKMAALHKATGFTSPRSDLNQLGFVLWELFNGFNEGMERAEPPGKIPKKLHDLYKRMATPAAAKQTVTELLRELRSTGGYCKSRYVDTLLFLEEFQLKESGEKNAFFNQLRENLDAFPDDVAKYKILPRLIHTYEYGDAGPNILIPMFKLGRLLSEEEYQRRIVPCLVKLFGSPDRTTRVKLLEKIDDFAPHLTPAIVNEKIYGNLSQGFVDSSPAVRESTVKAMVVLAEKLNSHNLNTDLMKYLAKLQGTDEHGGIRTNTTICLGKIAHLLDPSCRQRILMGAFTRGLKDPFPPARMAAVLALSATQQFYALIEIANRVLPALSPLTCDPEKQVRDQAFSALKGFLEKLEKASENPACIPELEAAVKAGGKGLLGSDKMPQWASWALKSLSGKFYKGPTPAQPGDPAAGAAAAPGGTAGGADVGGSTAGRKPAAAAAATSAAVSSSTGWDEEDQEEWKDAEEGGETKEGWADEGWEVESKSTQSKPLVKKPAAAAARPTTGRMQLGGVKKPPQKHMEDDLDELLGISSSRKTSASSTTAAAAAAPSSGGGWDDFGDDDFGATPTIKKSSPAPAALPAASKFAAAPAASDGWGDEGDGWAEEAPAAATTASKTAASAAAAEKEARRAEMAARNEARKKELAAKRAARTGGSSSSSTAASGGGAMKLALTKKNPQPELDGDWGNDGW
ncbi:hypothetical protein PENTCL1PPCAC_1766 [Pristionchus entomophagus]|uniref:Protein kinase domain-containing protein n=1 Tax=Pristionchus entomophagus TaxID=358040 RepID=A0AAV5S935_9BILA|nr:hypothetical protein PENTCL1PPCAC_1766 [Pristionchus entomophagus]